MIAVLMEKYPQVTGMFPFCTFLRLLLPLVQGLSVSLVCSLCLRSSERAKLALRVARCDVRLHVHAGEFQAIPPPRGEEGGGS